MTGYESKRAAAQDKLAQPEQEPVAWMVYTQDGQSVYVTDNPTDIQESQRSLPLYTTPPQRPWVDLTPQDLNEIFAVARTGEHAVNLAADKLKEKNNG
jgi:hypothetical protein